MTDHLQVALPHSTTNPKYLHSNSTSHVWVFGAVAELIDNSIDANATKLKIDVETVQSKPVLVFTDNGKGMDSTQLHLMLSFGHCGKKESDIGRYGNGFKSGSMRIGMDAMVFTRQPGVITVGFLSQSFLGAIHAAEVLVPIVSWDEDTHQVRTNSALGIKSDTSLEAILQHSPCNTLEKLFTMFNRIDSPTGTCIMIYNIKKHEHSEKFELDFSESHDIRIRNQVAHTPQSHPKERYSLRSYCAILYLNPTMAIFLRGKRVQSIRISSTLLEAKKYIYASKKGGQTPIIYGFVPKEEDKGHYGVMMYFNNRLIKSYVHVGPQLIHTNSVGKAVIGVVQANWLQPTHNKQDFYLGENKAKQYDLLIAALGEKLKQYWTDIGITQKGIGAFTKALWAKKPRAQKRKATTKPAKKIEFQKSKRDPTASNGADAENGEDIKEESGGEDATKDEEDVPLSNLYGQAPLIKSSSTSNPSSPVAPASTSTPSLIPTSLFPPACTVKVPGSSKPVKQELSSDGTAVRRVPVTCSQCFKWRMVSAQTANNLPDDWTCAMNSADPEHNCCADPEEDPEGAIPKAPKRKETAPELTIDERVDELRKELNTTREQFEKKDRARERKLIELESKADGTFTTSTIHGDEIIGKAVWLYWRVCDKWLAGKVAAYNSKKGTHKILYKHDEDEFLRLDDADVYFDDTKITPILNRVPINATFPNGTPVNSALDKLTANQKANKQDPREVHKIPKAKKSVQVQTDPISIPIPSAEKSKDKDRDRERDRDRDRDWDRDRDRERERDRDRDRDRDKDRERDRDRERGRERERERTSDRDKDKDRSTHKGTDSKDRDRERDRTRDEPAAGRKRDRSTSSERTTTKRTRSKSPPPSLSSSSSSLPPPLPPLQQANGNQAMVPQSEYTSLKSELDTLRASVKRFLRLHYPINSAEAEATEETAAAIFCDHVNKMESEGEVDLN